MSVSLLSRTYGVSELYWNSSIQTSLLNDDKFRVPCSLEPSCSLPVKFIPGSSGPVLDSKKVQSPGYGSCPGTGSSRSSDGGW